MDVKLLALMTLLAVAMQLPTANGESGKRTGDSGDTSVKLAGFFICKENLPSVLI